MAGAPIFRLLLVALMTRCNCEPMNSYSHKHGKGSSQFGELLKPPPPPLSNIVPVPFHGGASRSQRQNVDGYHYHQPPPPPPPPPAPPSSDFKFPAPFYKQYNFNFVPSPQPFTTTPSPSIFQKVSGWLFPSQQQSSYDTPVYNSNSIPTVKKDCNPCNQVPWIPVIRYDLGAKQIQHNTIPTYGPPSPTAYANSQQVSQFNPQPFHSQGQIMSHLSPGVPHAVYGPPGQNNFGGAFAIPSSTYGPPSPTHTALLPSQGPPSSTYSAPSSSYSIPSSSYGVPSSSIGQPHSPYETPSSSIGQPSTSYGLPSSTYGVPSSTYGAPTSTFATPSPAYENPRPITAGYQPVTPNYEPGVLNNALPEQNDVEILKDFEPSSELQLPKVTHPSGFRNSYGEPITNTYALDNIPYSVSATAAESTKIKTEVLPNYGRQSAPNGSLALANPAPFTLNRGRNIHTLQPVALPNLSVSPLPPIFNARPFRPIVAHQFNEHLIKGLNYMQQHSSNVNIEPSVSVAEYTHSVDYPPTVIKSPIIDIDTSKNSNFSKAYRNIPNVYILDEIRDISSQASEDHISATKSNQDASFESTGEDVGNDLYDNRPPSDLKFNSYVPSNHKSKFADLSGKNDDDVDKYRTESNLQNIDSPLLYLKPSAPHKDFENFVLAVSTPVTDHEYEIYDDIPTTISPQSPSPISSWDESKNDYSEGLVPPPEPQEDSNKPRIVQIIVPYTTGQQDNQENINYENFQEHWTLSSDKDYQGRKVPSNTEHPYANTISESYSTVSTTTEEPRATVTEQYDSDRLNTQAILNDLYDVKEPPFDIIKLQHTIDDWTAQEYSKRFKQQKTRTSAKYAKQIPDEYFTTISPITNYVTAESKYNYEFYDHEGSSSIQHSVTDEQNKTISKHHKEYNTIERTKTKHSSGKNEEEEEIKKPHIYTAASSFRSSTSTPAPWGKIQTSISPLTKEKVYVVTSKPWRDGPNESDKTNEWYDVETFESKKTTVDSDVSASDNLPFKSPRFPNRPSFGFTAADNEKIESLKSDSSYGFSKTWHQSINDLERQLQNNRATLPGGSQQNITTNSYSEETNVPNTAEDTATTTTAGPPESE